MPVQPMLDSLELKGVQRLRTRENRAVVEHRIPGLAGNVLQDLGRGPVEILIEGSLSYAEDRDGVLNLQALRETHQEGESVAFVADILTATDVQNVVIDDVRVKESEKQAGYFEFDIRLREFTPAPPSEVQQETQEAINEEAEEQQQEQETMVDEGLGILEVEVQIEALEDFSQIEVWVEGQNEDGSRFEKILREQTDGLYRLEEAPPGEYRVSAVQKTE